MLLGEGQTFGLGSVTDDASDFRIQVFFPILGFGGADDGFHIGAVAGDEDHDIFHAGWIIDRGLPAFEGLWTGKRARSC